MTDSEINEAVARKLGYEICPGPCSDSHYGQKKTHIFPPSDYCRSIEAAWEIVDHLRARGVSVDLMITPKLSRCTIREMAMGLIQTSAEAGPTDASRAICLAFLKLD